MEHMMRVGVPDSDPDEFDIAESISLTLEDFPPDRITIDDWTAPAWYGHDGWVIEHVWYSIQAKPGLGSVWDHPDYF